jgi:predicted glutamine amidotransferase
MCRWNAYFGQPVAVDELLFKTDHGLIDQSLRSRMGVETTNGDGFGLGWYTTNGGRPGRYRSVTPAWSDVNLRDLAAHVESPLFLPTSVRRPGRRCSRATAIRSARGNGCSSTTA